MKGRGHYVLQEQTEPQKILRNNVGKKLTAPTKVRKTAMKRVDKE